MANRIKGLDGGSIGTGSSKPLEPIRGSSAVSTATSSPGSASSSQADSVQITDSARTLATLSQAVRATPDINHERVAAVQQAIDSGQYTVNPQHIADRMVQLEQDLGGASKQ